jgi:hypothetical protein
MAWEYVNAAQRYGLRSSEALDAYKAGGGEIRRQWWFDLWHKAESASEEWGKIRYLSPSDTVPESMHDRVDINFSRKYVLNFSASATNAEGQRVPELYRYVESDRRLTWGEWQNAITQTLQSDPSFRGIVKYMLRDLKFYERARD